MIAGRAPATAALGAVHPVRLSVTAISIGLAIFVAGCIIHPPLGGLLALLVMCLVGLAVWLLIARPGLFLVLFLVYAAFAPLLSRLTDLPLGWFKGIFFLTILPVWILSRASRCGWSLAGAAKLPLLCYAVSVGVFGMLGLLSAARGIPLLQIIEALKGFLLYPPLLFIAFEASSDRARVRRFLWFALGLTFVVGIGALLQSFLRLEDLLRLGLKVETGAVVFIAIDPISGKIYQRLFSILDDQSSVAAFSFVGIALSLYLLSTCRGRGSKILVLIALALNAYTLLLTYNMTTLSGTILFVLILIVRRRSARLLAWFLVATLVIGTLAWVRYGELIQNRFLTSFSLREGVSTSLVARVESNRKALWMLREEPFLGRGMGSTANAFVYYRLGMRSSIEGGFATDNFYMTTALETGILGLSALLLLQLLPLIGLSRLGRRGRPDDRLFATIMGSAVFVLLLMNFSNGQMNTNPTNLLYWALAGMAFRGARDWTLPADSPPGGA